MQLRKIDYSELSAKQREIFNFQKLSALLADYGFNCIRLADDWQGADFLAYHKDGQNTLKVQLKGRVCVYKKYRGKDLYMAFPASGSWYLIEHDRLLDLVGKHTGWLDTDSWKRRGGYSVARPSRTLLDALRGWEL